MNLNIFLRGTQRKNRPRRKIAEIPNIFIRGTQRKTAGGGKFQGVLIFSFGKHKGKTAGWR